MSVGDFDGCPKRLAVDGSLFGDAPSFEVEFDGFAQIGAGALDVFALGGNVQFGAAGDEPAIFLGDERGEAVSHKAMLAKVA